MNCHSTRTIFAAALSGVRHAGGAVALSVRHGLITCADIVMFVRFINHERDRHSHQKRGVFQVAYDLIHADAVSFEQECGLLAAVRWFERHLTIPERSKLNDRAIFWFKKDARELIRRVWDLSQALRGCEVPIELVTTFRPGYIVYQDCFQVAAVPFRDTFKKK